MDRLYAGGGARLAYAAARMVAPTFDLRRRNGPFKIESIREGGKLLAGCLLERADLWVGVEHGEVAAVAAKRRLVIIPQGSLTFPERLEARFESPGFDADGRTFELHIDPIERLFLIAPDLAVHVQERGFSCQAHKSWSETTALRLRRRVVARWRQSIGASGSEQHDPTCDRF